jgi:hypothetical protein
MTVRRNCLVAENPVLYEGMRFLGTDISTG